MDTPQVKTPLNGTSRIRPVMGGVVAFIALTWGLFPSVGGEVFIVMAFLCLYFLPFVLASLRRHHNIGSILVVNLFLGWTFLGWVVALAIAMSAVRREP